jgi:hypothetical protein
MMQPRVRALAFLGGLIVLATMLILIWQAMPTAPAQMPMGQFTDPKNPPGASSGMGIATSTAERPDGKGKPPLALGASTTQDLPFVDLPGRRDGNLCDSGDFICISDDYRNATLSNPLTVSGTALVYEGRLSWRLLLGNGNDRELASGVVQAERAPDGVPAAFTIRAFAPDSMTAASGVATLVLFEPSLKDGQPIHVLRVPVRVSNETSAITVFSATPKTGDDCKTLAPMTIRVPKTALPVEASLQRLLLLRPTPERPSDLSMIPEGTKLLSFTLKDGVATAVFSRELDQGIAGSCRVSVIREQISRTLMQFPSIKKVVIIAEGKTEDTTLQP